MNIQLHKFRFSHLNIIVYVHADEVIPCFDVAYEIEGIKNLTRHTRILINEGI